MGEKQWVVIATREVPYEPGDYLGVFLSIQGAKDFCEQWHQEYGYKSPLAWKPYFQVDGAPSANEEAETPSCTYTIFWDQVEP